jgi:DNA-binding winged helix-turn-helix (wHTH) protein
MLNETEVSFLKKIQAVKFGYWTLLPKEQTIDDGETKRALEPLVFNILLYFILNNERIVSRQELIDDVWKQNYVDDNAINRAISELRKALKSDKQRGHVIKTHYRTGYSFMLPIELTYFEEKIQAEFDTSSPTNNNKPSETELTSNQVNSHFIRFKYIYCIFVLILLLSTIYVYSLNSSIANSPAPTEIPQNSVLEYSEEIISWEKGALDTPKSSKDNKFLAYTFKSSNADNYALHIKNMETLKEYKVITISEMVYPIAWSEKRSLIYQIIQPNGHKKCEIWHVDLSKNIINATHKKLLDCNTDEIISADISEDDNRLIYTKYMYRDIADLSAIVSRDLSTNTEFQVSSPNSEERGDYFVKLSHDMQKIVFLRDQPSGTDLFISNKDGSEQSKVYNVDYKITSMAWDASDSKLLWFNPNENSFIEFDLNTQQVKINNTLSDYDLGRRFRVDIISKDRFILATENQNFDIEKIYLNSNKPIVSDHLSSDEFEDFIAPFNKSSASIYLLGNNKQSIWLFSNGIRKKLSDIESRNITSLTISPDDTRLLLTTNDTLFIYQIEGFKLERTINLTGTIKDASWPIDDNILLTYAQSIKTYAWFYNLKTDKLIKLTNLQTDSSLLVESNKLLFFNEELQLIQKNIDTGDSEVLFQLVNVSKIIWTADKDNLYYIKNRFDGHIYKKPFDPLETEDSFPISNEKVIVELTLGNNKTNPTLYIMHVAYKDNYLLDMKLKK